MALLLTFTCAAAAAAAAAASEGTAATAPPSPISTLIALVSTSQSSSAFVRLSRDGQWGPIVAHVAYDVDVEDSAGSLRCQLAHCYYLRTYDGQIVSWVFNVSLATGNATSYYDATGMDTSLELYRSSVLYADAQHDLMAWSSEWTPPRTTWALHIPSGSYIASSSLCELNNSIFYLVGNGVGYHTLWWIDLILGGVSGPLTLLGFTDEGAPPAAIVCDEGTGEAPSSPPRILATVKYNDPRVKLVEINLSDGSYGLLASAAPPPHGFSLDASVVWDRTTQTLWQSGVGAGSRTCVWILDVAANTSVFSELPPAIGGVAMTYAPGLSWEEVE